jgi:hypothetical protein
MFFDWMNYWAALVPFHGQMLAEHNPIDKQGYKRYGSNPDPKGCMGIRDKHDCEKTQKE